MYKQYLIDYLEKTSINSKNEPFCYDSFIRKNPRIVRILEICLQIQMQKCKFFLDGSFIKKNKYEESFETDMLKLKIYTRINMINKHMKISSGDYINNEIRKIIEDVELLVKKYRHQHFQTKSILHRQSTIENCSLDFWLRLERIEEDLPVNLYTKLKKLVLSQR